MIKLLEIGEGNARTILPMGRDVAEWHQDLSAEIAAHLTPAHAALLAIPERRAASVVWQAPGAAMRRFDDLDPADRDRLTTATKSILSDIRRLAESSVAPAVAAAWPALRSIPDMTHLFAVDGRPVLAGWGFVARGGGAGPLTALDDGIAWHPAPRVPVKVYVTAMSALAGLALFAGLAVAPLMGALMQPPAACHAAPDQLALLRDQSNEVARSNDLRAQLAQLQDARAQQALRCPIPNQIVAPPRHADLPQERWDKHDLGMLQGCWNNQTQMMLRDLGTGQPLRVRSWVFCFNGQGRGHQTITLDNGESCRNDLGAVFGRDNTLQMRDDARCPFPAHPLMRGQLTCRRDSDTQAACLRRDLEGPVVGDEQPGTFRRADPTGIGPGQSLGGTP